MAVPDGHVATVFEFRPSHAGAPVVVHVVDRQFRVHGVVGHGHHLALRLAEFAQGGLASWTRRRFDHLQLFLEEQRIGRNNNARAVLGFDFEAGEDGGVEVGLGRFAQGIVGIHMEVGVLCMHLELAEVPVEGHHLAAAVASTEKPTGDDPVLHLGEVDEFILHGFGRDVHVHAAFGRVLVKVEQPFIELEVLGEFRGGFRLVFPALFLGIDLFRVALFGLLLSSFLGQTVHWHHAQQGRGKEGCRPTHRSFHERQGTTTFRPAPCYLKPRIFFSPSYAS